MATNTKRPKFNFTWFYLILGGLLVIIYMFGNNSTNTVAEKRYSELTEYITKGYVEEITVFDNDEIEAYIIKDSAEHVFDKPVNTKSSPTTRGLFTSIPLVASNLNCSSSDIAGSLSLSSIDLYKRPLVLKQALSPK